MTDIVERLRSAFMAADYSVLDAAADEIESLRKQLAALQSAVEHVTENGKTKRSFSASEGWAMVHKERLLDLEVAEEQLAECQAREAKLREAYRSVRNSAAALTNYCEDSASSRRSEKELEKGETIYRAITPDDTALKETIKRVKREALLEAANLCHVQHVRDDLSGDYRYGAGICEYNIRRMAEEIK